MIHARIHLDITGRRNFERIQRAFARPAAQPILLAMLKRWARIYLGFSKERFDRLSKSGGGGEWDPLEESTIRQRRHGKGGQRGAKAMRRAAATGGGQVSILRDTYTLYRALEPSIHAVGRWEHVYPSGIEVGIGGADSHPGGEGLTIGRLAEIHQEGQGRVPARPLLVEPNAATIRLMEREAALAVKQVIDQFRIE